ncbi:unnamed protein product [Bursaphelenchus xylophilus]|uniref:(pine wood nematode) hypothetical protein n=1 Tax=Bursaphelenchus xylophilus TaxID=6326 RepID=A0A7I8WUM7_BURXY|nr:unnamed protein product [Bursaphelenchus xylophilus]CAG9116980.1 unnamed protein product [Bursaphelenchus xylophilus]
MKSSRRLAIFISLVVYVIGTSLVLVALSTDFWAESEPLHRFGKASKYSYFHTGLFVGVRQLDYGYGPRREYFSMFAELDDGISFFGKFTWIFTLFLIGVGLIWSFVGLFVSFLNLFVEEINTVAGPRGLHIWSWLSGEI